jgi:hypothetical protein
MEIVRSDYEIERVEDWALEDDAHFPGMSYEAGILDTLRWLRDKNEPAPDQN